MIGIIMPTEKQFVEHFKATYDEFPDLPIWAAAETMTFGSMFTLFTMCENRVQKKVAKRYGLGGPVLCSWLKTLNYVRNICAHHARLWTYMLGRIAPRSAWRVRLYSLFDRFPEIPLTSMGIAPDWRDHVLWK